MKIIYITFTVLFLIGCNSQPDKNHLYQNYLNATEHYNDNITSYKLKYVGCIDSSGKRYHFVSYPYIWEVLPGNERGNGLLLIFDASHKFIGYCRTYGDPEISIDGTFVYLYYPYETEQNKRTSLDFSLGIPKTDIRNLGIDFEPVEEIKKY